jgi:hypothetical protein
MIAQIEIIECIVIAAKNMGTEIQDREQKLMFTNLAKTELMVAIEKGLPQYTHLPSRGT